ncbi:histidine phosphatase family protein [Paenibacillus sp. JX-17]|uniref:Histidine phosphatase family protein n=1 Tax=Paenibacillus lacisoli TaxID=3064525 RepID=A0ABT9CAK1_9BACL|nr:histidine phosphatase family protein [Paenibacillus sp. JX-17]MDO7906288.1 histidine phosphatase family protein [Paenibacillus sp. JX-17]
MRKGALGFILTLLTLFLSHTSALTGTAAAAPAAPPVPSLLNDLRQGGYILYIRHGEANVGEDAANLDFKDCSTQRNLSPDAKQKAAEWGAALRRLQIPVARPVLASPFCRTMETAALAFGQEQVQPDPFWVKVYRLSGKAGPAEQQATLAELVTVLEKVPPAGTNQVIVAHSFPEGLGLGDIPNLGTVIIKPNGPGKGYEIVGRVSPGDLQNLMK